MLAYRKVERAREGRKYEKEGRGKDQKRGERGGKRVEEEQRAKNGVSRVDIGLGR